MNRKIFFLLLILGFYLTSAITHAQKNQDKPGSITVADLELKTCSIDTAASAVVIFDKGETEFVPDDRTFDVLYTRTVRIKILKKSGIDFGEISIPLYQNYKDASMRDELRDISAFTYNLVNGKIVRTKADPKTIFQQKVNDHAAIKKLAFPDVHEGSVLEVHYEVRSPFKFKLHDWAFQWEIPVLYSEYILKYTPFFLYSYVLKNAVKFDEYKEYQVEGISKEFYNTAYTEGAYKFVMKNIPAFTETDFVSSVDEYLISLHFQLNKFTDTRGVSEDQYTTWDDLAKKLNEDPLFGKFLVGSQGISKQVVADEKMAELPPAERFDAIVSWVKANLSWDDHQRIYAENKPGELLKRKTGNSADINLFLCGMLKSADIESYPVLISTRGNAKVIKDYPFLDFFTYVMVIAKIGDKWVLTDGTEPFCENGTFPVRCINGKGLLLKGDKTSWVDVASKYFSSTENRVRLRFNAGVDSMDARFTLITKGYDALTLRKRIGDNHDKVNEYFSETGLGAGDSLIIRNSQVDSVLKPYIISLSGKLPAETTDQLLVIDPFCKMAISKNPFDKARRKYPVDFMYQRNKTLIMDLEIPPGYRVKKMPESFSMEDVLMTFKYTAQLSDNKVLLHAFYAAKNSVYTAEEYPRIKQFFADIVKKLNEKIYLEKL